MIFWRIPRNFIKNSITPLRKSESMNPNKKYSVRSKKGGPHGRVLSKKEGPDPAPWAQSRTGPSPARISYLHGSTSLACF